ncbi:unnamed protein product [Triticum turgidum subsp. durum]|uniref:Uncharacterized protein n=1 Tax=Triticum turgidum subsp. durum TaxID=4567 RepID=A0A9R0VTJ8_TRITD|nr:unnamed protein product [Triticum turgidum subsp. durum]
MGASGEQQQQSMGAHAHPWVEGGEAEGEDHPRQAEEDCGAENEMAGGWVSGAIVYAEMEDRPSRDDGGAAEMHVTLQLARACAIWGKPPFLALAISASHFIAVGVR